MIRQAGGQLPKSTEDKHSKGTAEHRPAYTAWKKDWRFPPAIKRASGLCVWVRSQMRLLRLIRVQIDLNLSRYILLEKSLFV